MKNKYVEDKNAGTVDIPKITTEDAVDTAPKKEIEIIPGKKVNVINTNKDTKGTVIPNNGVFTICQKLADGKVSLLGREGLILYVKPENIKYVK